jgi:hypothetical protein
MVVLFDTIYYIGWVALDVTVVTLGLNKFETVVISLSVIYNLPLIPVRILLELYTYLCYD